MRYLEADPVIISSMHGDAEVKGRRFWVLIGQAMCAGLLLRLDLTQQLGLNQFDEGVYAFSAGWIFDRQGLAGIDPVLIPYAPPGFSVLVGLMSLLIGLSDQACFLVSALAGTLTIPVVAVVARRIFGNRAAVVSAWCICCSGPHIAFSRSGLTDASFLLVWSVGCIAALDFLDRPGWRSASKMGLLVGLAQEFKYNGWLLGGLVLATSATCLFRPPPDRPRLFTRLLGRGLLGVVVASIVVLPWYSFVENHGGYAGLLAHQRSYLGGFNGWWPHLRDQADQAVALAGPAWLSLSGALAMATAQACTATTWPLRPDRALFGSWFAAGAASLVLGAAPATSVLLFISLNWRTQDIGRRFILVSGAVLFVLTPFYHPYARLWLPFELVHWLVFGDLIGRIAVPQAFWNGERPQIDRSQVIASAAGALILFAWGPGFPLARPGPIGHSGLFAPSDSLRHMADDVVRQVPADVKEVQTLIRPALSYYLIGRIAVRPRPDWEALMQDSGPGSWALVDSTILREGQGGTGPLVLGDPGASLQSTWEVVAQFDAANSLVATLDLDPSARSGQGGCSIARFWLLRQRPKGSPE